MCKLRAGWPSSIGILWKWGSKPTRLAGDGECRLTRFHPIRNFLPNKIYHFSRLSFYLTSPLHRISFLFSHFCLLQNAILHKLLKLGFWNFKPIFLRMQFSLVATFFFSSFGYQFELIFAFIFAHLHLTWHYLPGTLEAKWSFQTFKRPPSDWLGPKYKSKVTS